jgi:hypothetical protein
LYSAVNMLIDTDGGYYSPGNVEHLWSSVMQLSLWNQISSVLLWLETEFTCEELSYSITDDKL